MTQTATKARYEVLFLTNPELTQDDASMIESQLHSLISGSKGEVLSFEKWGKYRLCYRVSGNEYGIYFLARFELPQLKVQETLNSVRTFFAVKHRDLVLRSLIDHLDENAPLTYKRPESLEEAPQRDRQMEGYGASEGRQSAPESSPEEEVDVKEEMIEESPSQE